MGAFAPRPTILTVPTRLTLGQRFKVTVKKAWRVRRVTLIKTGSVTHSFNIEQRFMELPFTRSGPTLRITAPARAALAPPGIYLLFIIDSDGVPSVGRLVAL